VRPALSDARLALTEDGRIVLELKTPYRDGTTHFVFDPMTFLERLAAPVPPPRSDATSCRNPKMQHRIPALL